MRMTKHNSRGLKGSKTGYSVKHNSRDFDLQKADNINEKLSQNNVYWAIDNPEFYYHTDKSNHKSFEEVEKEYYEKHFKNQYEELQSRYKKNRQYKSMKSFDEWRSSKRYCPEETVLQFGNIDNKEKLDIQEVKQAFCEIINSEMEFAEEHKECFEILDFAIHLDEEVPHIHYRKVYKYLDNDGIEKIGQNKALEKAGLELPNPDKPISSKNNYKVTLDKLLRDKALEIAEKHGFEIIKEPEVDVKHNMSKNKAIQEKTRKLTDEVNSLIEEKDSLESDITEARKTLSKARKTLSEAQEEAQKVKDEVLSLKQKKRALKREIEDLKDERTTTKRSRQADDVIQIRRNKDGSERELPDIQG